MSNWDDATRDNLDAVIQAIECPHCQAFNKIGASPTIEVANGFAICWQCSKSWAVKPAAPVKAKKPSAA